MDADEEIQDKLRKLSEELRSAVQRFEDDTGAVVLAVEIPARISANPGDKAPTPLARIDVRAVVFSSEAGSEILLPRRPA